MGADTAGFNGQTPRERGGGDPAGLGAADATGPPETFQQGRLRELGGLAGSRGTANDHDLMRFQSGADVRDFCGNREVVREFAADARGGLNERTLLRRFQQPEKCLAFRFRSLGIGVQQVQKLPATTAQTGAIGQTQGRPYPCDLPPNLLRIGTHAAPPARRD